MATDHKRRVCVWVCVMVYRDTRKQVVNLPFAADSLTPSNHISLGQLIRMAIFPVICLLIQIANRFLGMEECSFLGAGKIAFVVATFD
ncbi:GM19552 [Drosophila sechellia]|uniref:GM19552 n=1 Tax=Drosophila sechellia TaxID=7238 RepID=B4HWB1_DROSE|nr:GM19552 [Drosophila sechellia]